MICTTLSITQPHEARSRNQDGRFRQKRADTHLGTIEAQYGELSDRRCDAHLGTIREASGLSLTQMVESNYHEVTHAPGLSGRTRNQDGRIRAKRGDTRLDTLERTYGHIASLPGNTPLWVLRALSGGHSLTYIVHHPGCIRLPEAQAEPQTV